MSWSQLPPIPNDQRDHAHLNVPVSHEITASVTILETMLRSYFVACLEGFDSEHTRRACAKVVRSLRDPIDTLLSTKQLGTEETQCPQVYCAYTFFIMRCTLAVWDRISDPALRRDPLRLALRCSTIYRTKECIELHQALRKFDSSSNEIQHLFSLCDKAGHSLPLWNDDDVRSHLERLALSIRNERSQQQQQQVEEEEQKSQPSQGKNKNNNKKNSSKSTTPKVEAPSYQSPPTNENCRGNFLLGNEDGAAVELEESSPSKTNNKKNGSSSSSPNSSKKKIVATKEDVHVSSSSSDTELEEDGESKLAPPPRPSSSSKTQQQQQQQQKKTVTIVIDPDQQEKQNKKQNIINDSNNNNNKKDNSAFDEELFNFEPVFISNKSKSYMDASNNQKTNSNTYNNNRSIHADVFDDDQDDNMNTKDDVDLDASIGDLLSNKNFKVHRAGAKPLMLNTTNHNQHHQQHQHHQPHQHQQQQLQVLRRPRSFQQILTNPENDANSNIPRHRNDLTAEGWRIQEQNLMVARNQQQQQQNNNGNNNNNVRQLFNFGQNNNNQQQQQQPQRQLVVNNNNNNYNNAAASRYPRCRSKYHARYSTANKHASDECAFCATCHLLEFLFNGCMRDCVWKHAPTARKISLHLKNHPNVLALALTRFQTMRVNGGNVLEARDIPL